LQQNLPKADVGADGIPGGQCGSVLSRSGFRGQDSERGRLPADLPIERASAVGRPALRSNANASM